MNKKLLTAVAVAAGLLVVSSAASAQGYYYPRREPEYYPYQEPERDYRRMRQLDFSFSIGEGGYISRCDYDYCDNDVYVAPFDIELLLGYHVTRFLSLDMAVDFLFDYYGYHYYENRDSATSVWTSFRPGVRFFLPLFFHNQLYFRAAVPLTFRTSRHYPGDDVFLPGLLFGIGFEWIWGPVGFFIEADIIPYFVDIYPHYYAIPAEGRIGVAFHF
jgi:hypothetical protein